jgi:shikimate dehydrogenase
MSGQEVMKACVLGWPISHSLSPKLHGHWLKRYDIPGSYSAMAVMPEQLKEALALLKDRGFRGCNLTMPLKEMALSLMDEHDESCLMSGAANTVVIENGKMKGYNSDGFGFVESLKAQVPGWNGDRTVIIGTGGAARGIIASLRAAGAKKFVLVNRTREKAERVATQFSLAAEVFDWEKREKALEGATLLVNCSNLGMEGQPSLDLSLEALPEEATVCDIVYRPLVTPLLQKARARGNKTVEGLPMLLHQGRLGFEHWFGRDPEVTNELYNEIAGYAA